MQLLLAGGAQGIGGRGRQLSGAFRRLQPFAHYVAQLNGAVAKRHVALANVIHDFSSLTTELGRHDGEIQRFVTSSNAALGNFANQQGSIQAALREFPSTLQAAQAGLSSSNRFTAAARPALFGLIPQAQALTPAFKSTERFFKQTTGPIRDQIRPFTRQIRPVLTDTKEGSGALKKTVTGFGNSLAGLNSFLNELSYKPKGAKQSYLFYLPWLNHDLNADFNLQDAAGPVQRAIVMVSCNGSDLAFGFANARPYLKALLNTARVPKPNELPVLPPSEAGLQGCGPTVAP